MKNLFFFCFLSLSAMEKIFEGNSSLISVGSMMTVSRDLIKNTTDWLYQRCRLDVFMPKKSIPFACNFMMIKNEFELSSFLRKLYNIDSNNIFSYIIKRLYRGPTLKFFNSLTKRDEYHNESESIAETELENDLLYIIIPEVIIKKVKNINYLIINHIKEILQSEESIINKNNPLLLYSHEPVLMNDGSYHRELINIKNFLNISLIILQQDGKISKKIQSEISLSSDFFVDDYILSPLYYFWSEKIIESFNAHKADSLCYLDKKLVDTITQYLYFRNSPRSLNSSLYIFLEKFLYFYKICMGYEEGGLFFEFSYEELCEFFEQRYELWKKIIFMKSYQEIHRFIKSSNNTSTLIQTKLYLYMEDLFGSIQINISEEELLKIELYIGCLFDRIQVNIPDEELLKLELYIKQNKICTYQDVTKILQKSDKEIFLSNQRASFSELLLRL
jgi:hypothetical protein